MTFCGRALGHFLAVLLCVTPAFSQRIGYIAEEDAPLTTVECALDDYEVWEDSTEPLMFCDGPDNWIQPVSCRNDVLFYVTTHIANATRTSSLVCTGGCTKLNIVDEWPGEGSTSTLYDCITNLKGIDTDVDASTLFWAVPDFILTQSIPTSETESPTPEPVPTDTSLPGPTETSVEEDPDEDNGGGGTSTGVIVGATVGGVAGVALIAAAIFIGMRIGKKKAAAGEEPHEVRESHLSQPPPTSSVAWTTPPPLDSIHTAHGSFPSSPHKSYHSPDVVGVEQPVYRTWDPQYAQQHEYPQQPAATFQPFQAEMPTGMHAQGWASSEQHPLPYEVQGSTPSHGASDRQ